MFSNSTFSTNADALWVNARWAIDLTWSAQKRLLSGVIGATLVKSVIPAGLALAVRGIVNAVAALLNGETADTSTLLSWLALGLVLTLADAISNFALKLFTQRLNDELNLKITSDILAHAADLDLAYFEDSRFQDVMERARQNTAQNFTQFVTNMLAAVTNIIQAITLIGILVVIEPLIILLLPPVALPYLYYQWRVSKTRFGVEHSRATKRRWTRYFVLRLTKQQLVPEVKLLGLAPLLRREFQSLLGQFRDEDRRLYIRSFVINVVFAFFSTVAAYIAFTRVALRVLDGAMTIGDVAIYGGAAARLRSILESTVLAITNALEQTLYVSNLMAFFAIKPAITAGEGIVPATSQGEIELRNVTFTYPGARKPSLKNVSLRIEPGETVALVGENGAGKTTLVKLVARLYDPDEGRLFFDGRDLRTLSLAYLYGQLSFVFQTYGRYEATVSDNIAYGNWQEMLHDRRRIEQIARLTDVHEMIEALPQKYDTLLGRLFGEYTLSGGQWQKIAIARAFTRDARLLILDEPTASLDAYSEYKLFTRFRELAEGRTTILISHRFSTVSMADRILVLDNGRIIEQGTHQELVDQGGHYADLYRLHQLQMPKLR